MKKRNGVAASMIRSAFLGLIFFVPRIAAADDLAGSSGSAIPSVVLAAVIGGSVGVGLMIHNARQRRKNQALWQIIEPKLREGARTIDEIAASAGMNGFVARGKVALCLNEMNASGRVEIIPAPDGTPQLQKKNFITYRLRA